MSIRKSAFVLSLMIVSAGLMALSGRSTGWADTMGNLDFEYKQVCIGRYDLEIPVHFEVEFLSASLNGFDVASLGVEERSAFDALVADRHAQLRAGAVTADGEAIRLLWARSFDNLAVLAFEIDLGLPGIESGAYDLEAYTFLDGSAFKLSGTVAAAQEEFELRELQQAAAGLNTETQGGFCFQGGMQPTPQRIEMVDAFIYDPEVEGFGITLSLLDDQAPESERLDPAQSAAPGSRPLVVDSLPAREMRFAQQARILGSEPAPVLRFDVFAGRPAQQGQPYRNLTIGLFKDALSVDEPPYDQEAAIALWERMLSSLRRR